MGRKYTGQDVRSDEEEEQDIDLHRMAKKRANTLRDTTALEGKPALAYALTELGFSTSGGAEMMDVSTGTFAGYREEALRYTNVDRMIDMMSYTADEYTEDSRLKPEAKERNPVEISDHDPSTVYEVWAIYKDKPSPVDAYESKSEATNHIESQCVANNLTEDDFEIREEERHKTNQLPPA